MFSCCLLKFRRFHFSSEQYKVKLTIFQRIIQKTYYDVSNKIKLI